MKSEGPTEHDWMLAWVSLAHAGTYLTGQLDARLRDELGYGLAEQDLLKQVDKNDGDIAMSALAQRLYYSKAGITKMVDRLESHGLLARHPSSTDRRIINITITDDGRRSLDRSRSVLMTFVRDNFRAHLDDEQVVNLRDALRALLEGLGRYQGQARHLKGDASDG